MAGFRCGVNIAGRVPETYFRSFSSLRRKILRNNDARRSISSSNQSGNGDETTATIVQGPSLLTNTGRARPSPSLFFLPGLRSIPFWTSPHSRSSPSSSDKNNESGKSTVRVAFNDPTLTEIVDHLESHYESVRDEYMSAILGVRNATSSSSSVVDDDVSNETSSSFRSPLQPDYDVNTKGVEHAGDALHEGQWDWHSYVQGGARSPDFRTHCPVTTRVVDEVGSDRLFFGDDDNGDNPFGFCFFSTLAGNSRIRPHSGPMNLRLRIHLPLLVPETTTAAKATSDCGLRVGTQSREWVPGKAIVLDDSFEHEVWNDTPNTRVVLLLDVWHPDVAPEERARVRKMFRFAKDKGWLGKK